jgi:hypothetical protein
MMTRHTPSSLALQDIDRGFIQELSNEEIITFFTDFMRKKKNLAKKRMVNYSLFGMAS